ncbi:MAG: hypothetical protein ACE5E1_03430 [Phycisphaerae bacterium]
MFKKIRHLRRVAKAAFGIGLVLNVHVWLGGCGMAGVQLLDGKLLVPLTPDHAMTQTLAGSAFEGATAMEIDPAASRFRLIYPDAGRNVSGTYHANKGRFSIRQLQLARGALSAEVMLDDDRHVLSIETGSGLRWERPADWTGLPPETLAGGLDAYIAANIELVDAARQLDGGGARVPGSTTGGGGPGTTGGTIVGKAGPSAQDATGGLADVLAALVPLLGLQLAVFNWPSVFFVFQTLIGAQLLMAVAGIAPLPTAGTGVSSNGDVPAGSATLRVTNNRSDGVPIWFVTLIEDAAKGLPGGNLLGDESIPAGESREFSVPAGTRNLNLIIPIGVDCFELFAHEGVELTDGQTTELTLEDQEIGKVFPDGCDQG